MEDSVQGFSDQFADTYHLIFADWEKSVERQAGEFKQWIEQHSRRAN